MAKKVVSGLLFLFLIPAIHWNCSSPVETSLESANPQPSKTIAANDSKFVHMVYFWLKEGVTEQEKQSLMKDCRELLGTIPSVRSLIVGKPAGTPREVVDNSYSVGLVVYFDDAKGHDLYQEAEKHLEFIDRNQHIWERVQVYDLIVP